MNFARSIPALPVHGLSGPAGSGTSGYCPYRKSRQRPHEIGGCRFNARVVVSVWQAGAVVRGSHAVFAMLAVGKGLPRHTPTGEGAASTAFILRRPGVRSDGGGRRPAELPRLAPSPAVAPVAVPAMLPAWTAEPPTCCRQVMFARRKVCGPTHSKSRSFKNGLPFVSDSVFKTPAPASCARTAP